MTKPREKTREQKLTAEIEDTQGEKSSRLRKRGGFKESLAAGADHQAGRRTRQPFYVLP